MTQDERHQEQIENSNGLAELERTLKCLRARGSRYIDQLAYMQDCLEKYLTDEALGCGGYQNPDYRFLGAWPTEDDLRKLFSDTQDTFRLLSRAKARRELF